MVRHKLSRGACCQIFLNQSIHLIIDRPFNSTVGKFHMIIVTGFNCFSNCCWSPSMVLLKVSTELITVSWRTILPVHFKSYSMSEMWSFICYKCYLLILQKLHPTKLAVWSSKYTANVQTPEYFLCVYLEKGLWAAEIEREYGSIWILCGE